MVEASDPTRKKIVNAAGEIFAEQGYQAATIREICSRAGVNVAAVNYHFRDKAGLYVEAIRQSVGSGHCEAVLARQSGLPPEEVLRQTILGLCRRMIGAERPSWAFRLMAHELGQPTPALAEVVSEIIRPNYETLRATLAAILHLPPDHETTRMCAHSVIGQIIHYVHARPVIALLWPDLKMTPETVEMLAAHIAAFSVCSVQELARKVDSANAEA